MARTGLTRLFHFFDADCAAGFVQAPGYLDLFSFVFLRSRLVVELVRDVVRSPDTYWLPDFMIVPANVWLAFCFCISSCWREAGC